MYKKRVFFSIGILLCASVCQSAQPTVLVKSSPCIRGKKNALCCNRDKTMICSVLTVVKKIYISWRDIIKTVSTFIHNHKKLLAKHEKSMDCLLKELHCALKAIKACDHEKEEMKGALLLVDGLLKKIAEQLRTNREVADKIGAALLFIELRQHDINDMWTDKLVALCNQPESETGSSL
ncbi:MAG: hypothetical protein NT124_00875 [Candidatus Dependentiae bacterium]|nr:hypothetical protein [Candidatus Dependentiae bacterium]